MTIQDLKNYVAAKKKTNAELWRKQKAQYGDCTPFTFEEYMKYKDIIISGKKVHKTKFVHNKLWQITK